MAFDPTERTDLSLMTLAQLASAGPWQLSLVHDRAQHVLIWITRGQGVALLDGARRGFGAQNALFVPARHLMAIEPGRQCMGMALIIPGDSPLTLPQLPRHLRIRDPLAQSELTMLLEAQSREQQARRPLYRSASAAFADLAVIWLRRQIDLEDQPIQADTAAHRLSRRWCARLVTDYADPMSMADHAAALGVTPTHLTRVSRAQTGRTAARLLSERQLHAAHQLLITTRVPAHDIARHLGFGSAAYFTRFIKQHTGVTPTMLRRAGQKQS